MDSLLSKPLPLEERTLLFAQDVRHLLKRLPKHYWLHEDVQQLIRSSGSVAANYIEANESIGKNDFKMRLRICLKEAKESRLWLRLLEFENEEWIVERERLVDEAYQLVRIFSAALRTIRLQKDNNTH